MKGKVYKTIILGCGISGLSLAYWMKKYKSRGTVLVIDSKQFLQSAAAKNAGFLTVGSMNFYNSNYKNLGTYVANELLDFCQTNHELLFKSGLLGEDVNYKYGGSYSVTSESENLGRYQTSDKCDFELIPGENCFYYPLDGSVDSPLLLEKLKNTINADYIFGESANIDVISSKIEVAGESISYKRLFIANNAWANQLIEKPVIKPVRAQIFRSHPIKKRFAANYYFSDDLTYFRQDHQGRILIGGKRMLDENTEYSDTEEINNSIQEALLNFAKERIDPSIEVEKYWSGIMGFSDSGLPQVGKVSDNIFFQVGFSAHGMGMAFHLAQLLCQWALKGRPPKQIPPSFFT